MLGIQLSPDCRLGEEKSVGSKLLSNKANTLFSLTTPKWVGPLSQGLYYRLNDSSPKNTST